MARESHRPVAWDMVDLFWSPLTTTRMMSKLQKMTRYRSQGGCQYGCSWDRTDDSRLPWSSEQSYGGWGGHEHFGTDAGSTQSPILFVHGNQRDCCDWEQHATAFLDRGLQGDDLWAITFSEGTPTHTEMAAQLDHFITHIRDYTGQDEVVLVSHSLGVTGCRYWLEDCDRYDWVKTLIGLAGPNHGTRLATLCCAQGMARGPYRICRTLRDDYAAESDRLLARLNRGSETPGDVQYHTIRGTNDTLFWRSKHSPMLEGAENLTLPVGHEGVRTDARAVDAIYRWATP